MTAEAQLQYDAERADYYVEWLSTAADGLCNRPRAARVAKMDLPETDEITDDELDQMLEVARNEHVPFEVRKELTRLLDIFLQAESLLDLSAHAGIWAPFPASRLGLAWAA